MTKTILPFASLCLALIFMLFSCKPPESGPWNAFKKCATNACVKEVVAVTNAFLADPKPIFAKFKEGDATGEDHYIGWLYILRDSVLRNSAYASTEERIALQQKIIGVAKPFESDAVYGDFAKSIVGEFEVLAIASELEDLPADYATITGTYAYELPNEDGSGELKVAVTDAENLQFSLDVVGKAPAHNQGMMEGSAKLVSMNVYEAKTTEFGGTCRLQFTFDGEAVEIKTLEGDPVACGFGNGVTADYVYRARSFDNPFLQGKDAKTAKNLLGTWVSTTDPKSEINLENGRYADIYDGENVGNAPYHFHPNCPKDCSPVAATPCLVVSAQDNVCYTVVKADGKTLELSQIGGTGNTLVFKWMRPSISW